MSWLSDDVVVRLRTVSEQPDFSHTKYRLVREIARGGMGVVYEAEDSDLRRRVAIKILASEHTSADGVERMRAEARIIALLEHPGIVPLHDAGILSDGRLWYAMKLVRGRRLDEIPAPPLELLRIVQRICEAVAFAHAQGVVHCDLKPENIMLGDFGEVLVMDWGVAHQTGATGRAIVGTRGFMAPEQERGDMTLIDPRTDVYALGAMLRGLLPARLPKPLAAICAKAAAPEQSDRYASAGDLAADITLWLDNRPVSAYRENAGERVQRWFVRNRALVTVVVAYLLMRIIVVLWFGR